MPIFKLLISLALCALITQCSDDQSAKDAREQSISAANKIATSLDTISSALNTVEDYDTMRKAEAQIDFASEKIINAYKSIKKLKTDKKTSSEIKELIEPASKKLTTTRLKVINKFRNNPAVTYGLVIMFNRISKEFSEVTGVKMPTQISAAPSKTK